jgi:hypothetical protein
MNVAVSPATAQLPVPTSSATGPAATRALPLLTATMWFGKVEDAVTLVSTIETVEYAEWIKEIGHLAPFAVPMGLGPGSLTSARNRFQ